VRKPRYLVLDNKRYLWRDILKLRREQCKAAEQAQPVLFTLQDDERPKSQRTAAARHEEPTLFSNIEGSEKMSMCAAGILGTRPRHVLGVKQELEKTLAQNGKPPK
jgi:hypothetical protein